VDVGLKHIALLAGYRSYPERGHTAEEEIFFYVPRIPGLRGARPGRRRLLPAFGEGSDPGSPGAGNRTLEAPRRADGGGGLPEGRAV